MTPLLIGGISLGTGLLNYFSEQSKLSQEQENMQKVLGILEDQKITPQESTASADRIGDYFNLKTLDTLNNSSIGLAIGGVNNPEAVKSKIAGTILAEKDKALIDQYNKELDINRRVGMAEAELRLKTPVNKGIESFISGATSGVGMGLSIENLENQFDFADFFNFRNNHGNIK